MRWNVVLSASALLFFACSGSGGSAGDTSQTPTDMMGDGVEVEVEEEKPPTWYALKDSALEGVTKVRGFDCKAGTLFLSVEGMVTEGLYYKTLSEQTEFGQAFTGTGFIEVIDAGVLVGDYNGQTSSLVLAHVDSEAEDLGYNFEAMEIKDVQLVNDMVFTLGKDTAVAEYLVHRGGLAAGVFEQLGSRLNETTISMYVDGTSVYLLSLLNEVTGMACHTLGTTSVEANSWNDCPGFPQYVKDSPGKPYSVEARIFGSGPKLAAWFRVSDKGENSYVYHTAPDGETWTDLPGLPDEKPSTWRHRGQDIYMGYSAKSGFHSVYRVDSDGTVEAEGWGLGLPDAGANSGPAGFCEMSSMLYVAWLDYNVSGSAVTIYRLNLE
jgi:hypothetical protein